MIAASICALLAVLALCLSALRLADLRAKHAIELARTEADGRVAVARAESERTAEAEAEDLEELAEELRKEIDNVRLVASSAANEAKRASDVAGKLDGRVGSIQALIKSVNPRAFG